MLGHTVSLKTTIQMFSQSVLHLFVFQNVFFDYRAAVKPKIHWHRQHFIYATVTAMIGTMEENGGGNRQQLMSPSNTTFVLF